MEWPLRRVFRMCWWILCTLTILALPLTIWEFSQKDYDIHYQGAVQWCTMYIYQMPKRLHEVEAMDTDETPLCSPPSSQPGSSAESSSSCLSPSACTRSPCTPSTTPVPGYSAMSSGSYGWSPFTGWMRGWRSDLGMLANTLIPFGNAMKPTSSITSMPIWWVLNDFQSIAEL